MRTSVTVLFVAAVALGCHGKQQTAQRTQQQYDVVEEGQTTSATSTINAPGEVATATNTDTTGSFTLTTTPAANMPGGPTTGVMPPQQPGAMASGMPAPAPTTVRVTPPATQTQYPYPPPRPIDRRPPPPQTETMTTTTSSDTAPPADTATTDTTSTQPPKKKDKKDGDTPPSTETSTTTAPPPTQTDTIGNH